MSLNIRGIAAWHALKQQSKESISHLKEGIVKFGISRDNKQQTQVDRFENVRKKRWELVLLSGAVCGIEFCYAAETAFVTPILLNLGLDVKFVTLIWCLSPIIGFIATPVLGSLSDRCASQLGRRRPFILLLSVGILIGLILVPNGHLIGITLGDMASANKTVERHDTILSDPKMENALQPWSILFTVIGAVLLDFCSDACQSPCRTFLLDVTIPEDHGIGLSTFTMMAGLGGSVGYLMGGVNWETTVFGHLLGGHVRTVFTFVTVLFVVCVLLTITSFSEVPLCVGSSTDETRVGVYQEFETDSIAMETINYGSAVTNSAEENFSENCEKSDLKAGPPNLKQYLLSIIYMPKSLRILCLTNLFCWMSLVCYSLYFTDFVGEIVFGGNPKQVEKSKTFLLYQEGVRYGCYGMALYSISCTIYSYYIESLIEKFGAKKVYVGGQLVYSAGMATMALCRHKMAVLLLSPTAGFMYATLFTMPYLLVAHYHCTHVFEAEDEQSDKSFSKVRGIGTDVAVVSSMVFLSQFLLSLGMGNIVSLVGSSTATVCAASFLSACGALCATQIFYLDL